MKYFVNKDSIVREIWGKSDTILFIFAGASAEFALNKAVDWLYFTGRLPSDPLGRLFSTVAYARKIVFSTNEDALKAIDTIAAIHKGVEQSRGAQIPDWAYRDVLFMLVDYSIRSFEVLERKLSHREKAEAFDVFLRVGQRMNINGLPENFNQWLQMRDQHLAENLVHSKYTAGLYRQYRKHLGWGRYQLLLQVQALVTPPTVATHLGLCDLNILPPVLALYKVAKKVKLGVFFRNLLLPGDYKDQVISLDVV